MKEQLKSDINNKCLDSNPSIIAGFKILFLLISVNVHASTISFTKEKAADESLELHYKFDESTGVTEIVDYSGKGRTGTISVNANITLGVEDSDLTSVLQKTGSGTVIANNYEGVSGNGARTVSFYFKQDEPGFCNIFKYGEEESGMVLLNVTAAGKFRFVNKVGGSFLESQIAIQPNEWVHLAWVIQSGSEDAVDAKLYLNGVLTDFSSSAGFDNTLNTITSGDVNAIDNYDGSYYMSDLRVYSKALEESEVLDLLLIKQDQQISFTLPSGINEDLGSLKLSAKSSSGLGVSFTSSNQSVATISGNTLTVVGQGTTNITASQVGNQYFKAAPSITRSLTVHSPTDPGTAFDLQAFIDSKIAQGEKEITLPAGRLRVPMGQNNTHLYFENLEDITLIGNNTELICTETVQAIKFLNCKNFKIQGINIDYDPLPFTQGVITAISGDKSRITVDLLDGYPTTVINSRVEIFDAESGELATSTYYGITHNLNASARQVIITKTNFHPDFSFEKVGDIAVLDSEGNRRIPHAVLMDDCTGMILEDVLLYAGTSFGFFERNCSNSKYTGCKVIRRPIEDELVPRALRRMRSNNLDGFHSKHAEIGPNYTQCVAQYNGDDGFAVNGDYHIITETNDNLLIVIGKAGDMPNILPGDSVELVSYTGERVANAKVISITKGRAVSNAERAFLNSQNLINDAANTRDATDTYIVEVDHSVDLPLGSLIASANRIGNGAKVIGCVAGPTRSRGILIKSSNVIISDNIVNGTWGQAIKMSPEYKWLEAGTGVNIKVTNNTITNSHEASIAIYAIAGNGETGLVGSHKNVEISGNQISNSVNPGIAVTSTSGLLLENNTISNTNNSYIIPGIEDFGNAEDPAREIYLENIEYRVVVESPLHIEESILSITVFPNPVSAQLNIHLQDGKPKPYIIYDANQRVVFASPNGTDQWIDTSFWTEGIYFLHSEGHTYKIIKKRR